eukprot:COSAG01_NODE_1001_length_12210_cov_60.505491_18_plen_68_part_00
MPWRLGRCLLIANLKAGFWCAAAVCCLVVPARRRMGPAPMSGHVGESQSVEIMVSLICVGAWISSTE